MYLGVTTSNDCKLTEGCRSDQRPGLKQELAVPEILPSACQAVMSESLYTILIPERKRLLYLWGLHTAGWKTVLGALLLDSLGSMLVEMITFPSYSKVTSLSLMQPKCSL